MAQLPRSRLVTELRYLFYHSGSLSLPHYLDYFPPRVTFALFDPVRLACFGTRLFGRNGIRVLLCTAAAVYKKTRHSSFFLRFN